MQTAEAAEPGRFEARVEDRLRPPARMVNFSGVTVYGRVSAIVACAAPAKNSGAASAAPAAYATAFRESVRHPDRGRETARDTKTSTPGTPY
ncbi:MULTISPECIES: hypothetical protein [unclassified Streptomyces]|uniref:hypothetical protein n=1 Tax=unclassified Streptomyces TaxID=2593676 RepID=UPI00225549E2|nr:MULTISPECIES: hypothetical protein [unclassified Streptomyces]WSP60388.1 hypothetical protein OG306_33865 [Streptomyces sp. NBC_01241]MCX4790530.1 hypothetical protein [Streptomyces sp. NBC_01221]MCX4793744.1 hypothetical protein [Streptomyces sp. NBC_01242]WSJ41336.1 hypothetical protein OG772_03165 [Streptomyces sp. NBC_01321]WSP67676.1 hypothetical protein OG466_06555 [Streptomyces sp. NBC_01240]